MKIVQITLPTACAVAMFLSACSSTPEKPPANPPAQAAVMQPSPPPAPAATSKPMPSHDMSMNTLPAYLDPKNPVSTNRSVYFDFDESTVKAEYNSLIALHGNFLAAHPTVAIKIEGNTDERGSAEYNLALGQRRAESVERALELYGVKAGQMEAVSWGEERPKAVGHDESAWSQNRRADLTYPSK